MLLTDFGYIKIHINEINIKHQVWNCCFNNSIEAKNIKTKNNLIDEKSYKDLVIYFTRYLHNKSIKILRFHYHELIGKTDEHEGKDISWLMIIC